MSKYFITGLPRSRTTWMSRYMPNCVHEPIAEMRNIENLIDVYARYDGVSDSGLGLWIDWILANIKPKTLIIERDIGEVEKSLEAMGMGLPRTNFCDLLLAKLNEFKDHPLVMTVPFAALGNERVMQRVWWHLLGPNVAFDEEYFHKMNAINIKASPVVSIKDTIIREIMPFIRLKEASCL
jgi:hypothetical protein